MRKYVLNEYLEVYNCVQYECRFPLAEPQIILYRYWS